MVIAFPSVDGVAPAIKSFPGNRFTECGVRDAIVGAELNQPTRAGGSNNPVRKWNMTIPAAFDTKAD
jgi:hypothetical protein